jgi:Mg/Co/Ni transporter MgtE
VSQPAAGDPRRIRTSSGAGLRRADVGRDLSRRGLEDGKRILDDTDDRWGSATLRATHPSIAARLLGQIDSDQAARVLGFMPTDHLVAIAGALSPAERMRIEGALPVADRELVERLLKHPEGTVGRLRTTKIWRTPTGATIGAALAALRAAGLGSARRERAPRGRRPGGRSARRGARLIGTGGNAGSQTVSTGSRWARSAS